MSFARSLALAIFALAAAALPARATSMLGPAFPPTGGSVSYSFTGVDAGSPGGRNINFWGFSLSPAAIDTYWGPASAYSASASLDGSPDLLTFSGIAGAAATWAGTTSWTNPDTSIVYPSVPIELVITVTGLGASPWVLATSPPGLDPGVGAGIGAVVDTLDGTSFTANLFYRAKHPVTSAWTAINSFEQAGGGLTTNSFTGDFYTLVPEPGTAMLLASGLAGLGAALRKRG